MQNKKQPIFLSKPTVIEASFELRCDFSQPVEVVAVELFKKYASCALNGLERLPTNEIPELIRQADPNLQNAPLYQIRIGAANIQIGRFGVRYVQQTSYPGWESLHDRLKEFLGTIFNANIVVQLKRVALRYINFLIADAANVCKISFNSGMSFRRKQFNHTDIFEKDDFTIKTVIANQAKLNNKIDGSLLDIDISCNKSQLPDFKEIDSQVEMLHSMCRDVFFSSLSDDFLNSLEPKYE